MSYRFNSFDIVVAVGLCAILFGGMLIILAASGTLAVGGQQRLTDALPTTESASLQPALGRAIMQRALLQRESDRMTAAAMSELNRAVQAYRSMQPTSGRPLSAVIDRAIALPKEHEARVQAVMGRSVVNFTQRGVRGGVLSADLYLSDFNHGMITATQNRGKRMHDEFASSWQSLLGTWIVYASKDHLLRAAAMQEQLGSAIFHVGQARIHLEDAWSANQVQLGSLMAALDRSGVMREGVTQLASVKPAPEAVTTSGAVPVVPEISMAYLISAGFALCTVFFAGLLLSTAARESKALAESRRNAGRWVYRMASS
jgi:hypothetical protein